MNTEFRQHECALALRCCFSRYYFKPQQLLVELQTLVENDQLTQQVFQQELQQIALQVEVFWLNLREQVFPILVAELAAMSTAQHNELIAAATYVD